MASNPAHGSKDKAKGKAASNVIQFRTNYTGGEAMTWAACDAELLRLAVDALTRAGAAIILGVTSDGGAYSLCVLDSGQKAKEYPHGAMELEATLRAIVDHYTS